MQTDQRAPADPQVTNTISASNHAVHAATILPSTPSARPTQVPFTPGAAMARNTAQVSPQNGMTNRSPLSIVSNAPRSPLRSDSPWPPATPTPFARPLGPTIALAIPPSPPSLQQLPADNSSAPARLAIATDGESLQSLPAYEAQSSTEHEQTEELSSQITRAALAVAGPAMLTRPPISFGDPPPRVLTTAPVQGARASKGGKTRKQSLPKAAKAR